MPLPPFQRSQRESYQMCFVVYVVIRVLIMTQRFTLLRKFCSETFIQLQSVSRVSDHVNVPELWDLTAILIVALTNA